MGIEVNNFFSIVEVPNGNKELFETLLEGKGFHIERIISAGQTTPVHEWYEQAKNEWVLLLQGNAILEWENEDITHLKAGDFLHIPAGKKHRVAYTSKNPHCIWLAIHYQSDALCAKT